MKIPNQFSLNSLHTNDGLAMVDRNAKLDSYVSLLYYMRTNYVNGIPPRNFCQIE